jgi:cytochrome P450
VTLHPTTIDEIDFWDLDMFVSGDPHAAWRILREEAPVWWHDKPGGEPFWSVTRYDDARAVLGDPFTFSSTPGIKVRTDRELEYAQVMAQDFQPIIHTDPPRHREVRKLVSHRFTPRAVSELEAQIRSYAARCMDEAAQKGEIDFVTDIAHRIPAAIALSLLGVPEAHWDRLAELEHATVTSEDPEFTHGNQQEAIIAASMEIRAFFTDLVQSHLDDPGDDILSEFLKGRIRGEQLEPGQVVAEAGLLLAGGLDTTRAAASAGGIVPLLRYPDQLDALMKDRSLLATAVEEFVRWATPVVSETRTVMKDIEFGGHEFEQGQRVVVWTASANRDEDQFADPFTFDIRRSPNRHLGFAYGEHFCLGVHLARLTLLVEFDELLEKFKGFELTGEPVRVRSNFVGGLKHLPMRVIPR